MTERYLANVHRYPVGVAAEAAVAWCAVWLAARIPRSGV